VSGEHRASSPRKQSRPGDGCSRASETEIGHEPAQREQPKATESTKRKPAAANPAQRQESTRECERASPTPEHAERAIAEPKARADSRQGINSPDATDDRPAAPAESRRHQAHSSSPADANTYSPRTAAERDGRKPAARARHSKAARAVANGPRHEPAHGARFTVAERDKAAPNAAPTACRAPAHDSRPTEDRARQRAELARSTTKTPLTPRRERDSKSGDSRRQTAAGPQQHSRPGDGCARHRRPAEPVPSRSSPQCDGGSGGGRSRHSLRCRHTAPQPRNP